MEGVSGLDVDMRSAYYISVVQSPFGNLGVAVCLDAFSADVRERLKTSGSRNPDSTLRQQPPLERMAAGRLAAE